MRSPVSRAGARSVLAALFLCAALAVPAVAAEDRESIHCGPFDLEALTAADSPSREPGIAPGQTPPPPEEVGAGPFRSIPDGQGQDLVRPSRVPGEALLALPKGSGGEIPRDYELAPEARIAGAFFSPILCATVARVVGPAGVAPEALVSKVPDTAIVVPHHLYATAGTVVELAAPPAPSAVSGSGGDPYRPLQYNLARAEVSAARPLTDGSGVRVAVLDSAAQSDHRDLARVRTLALDGGSAPAPGLHGTLIAGVIAAVEGNGYGIASLAPGADILSIPVCRPVPDRASDVCSLVDMLQGVDRAWSERADIVNLSLVGPDNPLLERAMLRLEELGVLTVAAAGNEATDEPRYPAAYRSVIGVGAIDVEAEPFERTNRGSWVEVFAPGVEVLSTVPGDGFAFGSGTSLSAAHVTGVLALLQAVARDAPLVRAAFTPPPSPPGGATLAPAAPAPRLALPVCRALRRMGHPCPP